MLFWFSATCIVQKCLFSPWFSHESLMIHVFPENPPRHRSAESHIVQTAKEAGPSPPGMLQPAKRQKKCVFALALCLVCMLAWRKVRFYILMKIKWCCAPPSCSVVALHETQKATQHKTHENDTQCYDGNEARLNLSWCYA
jgi:hypothetical protein